MALTANQARALTTAARTSSIEEVYTLIENAAKEGNISVLLGEHVNYDIKAALQANGFTVDTSLPSVTTISWPETVTA